MPNKVYVINKHGRPLMPCSPAKARHLLDEGKALSLIHISEPTRH